MNVVTDYLKSIGFVDIKPRAQDGEMKYDFDLMKRVHEITYIVWYENLNHLGIASKNTSGKKKARGYFEKYKVVLIPKPVYSVKDAKNIIEAIST